MLKQFMITAEVFKDMYKIDDLKIQDKKWYKNHLSHKSKIKRKNKKKGKK